MRNTCERISVCLHFVLGYLNHEPAVVKLSHTPANTTQCTDIAVLDNDAVAVSRQSFILLLDSAEEAGFYIDRRFSHLVAFVEIIDDGVPFRTVYIHTGNVVVYPMQRPAMLALSFSVSQDLSACHSARYVMEF